ncbi:hypothetical protein [Actinomyces urogenitalis]|uniref:hypothetical protein n=1 Tax=Actinomyces urogenitalis TaxID=103621 RepID=UPI0026A57F31
MTTATKPDSGTYPTRRRWRDPSACRATAHRSRGPRLVVLIPAYKPDNRLTVLVSTLRRDLGGCQVLVVDDGSGPEYSEVFDAARERGAAWRSCGAVRARLRRRPRAGRGRPGLPA